MTDLLIRRAVSVGTLGASLLLFGCGGGGGDSTTSSGGPTSTTLTVSGTAATGLAISGATVTAKCFKGSGNATSLSDGSYTLTISDGQLPCVLEIISPADGTKLHSVVTGTSSTLTANITPLTEMTTARTLGSDPSAFFAAFDADVASLKVTTARVQSAQADVGLVLAGTIDTTTIGDFLTTPLAIGDSQDKLLDALELKLSSAKVGTIAAALASSQTLDDIKKTVTRITTPVTAKMVSAGLSSSVALLVNGTVSEWGLTTATSPSITEGLSDITSVSAGSGFAAALKSDGTVWTWGINLNGRLGHDTTELKIEKATKVSGLSNVVSISAGYSHVIALKTDGTVATWGLNDYGQLGDGTLISHTMPQTVNGLTGVIAVSAGAHYSVALKSDGTVVAWGQNTYGQLCDGTTTDRYNPTLASSMTHIVKIDAGHGTFLSLKDDGTVYVCGAGTASKPTIVTGLSNVSSISAGSNHYLALTRDGNLFTWGNNTHGELGNGTLDNSLKPIQVHGVSDVVQISAGGNHSIVIKRDGSMIAWGDNGAGQVGIGGVANGINPTYVLTPEEVLPVRIFQTFTSYDVLPNTFSVGERYNFTGATTSGLPVSISTHTPSVCTVNENTLQGLSAGKCQIDISQAGTADFVPIRIRPRTVTVVAASSGGGSSGGGSSGSGLAGTWCTDVRGDENCWVFDNNTGSSNGSFYQQSINQYSGTLTNTMTWSVQGGNLTYRFTRSTLSNSSHDYDNNPFNGKTYTFPYKVSGSSFIFQGLTFTKK